MDEYHTPVLLEETIEYLKVTKGQKYIDCTIGGGGHTARILETGGKVLGIDQDPEAVQEVERKLKFEILNSDLAVKQGNFAHLKTIAREAGFDHVGGILFDLGVSTHQLKTGYRGFSFNQESSLDMRMDPANQSVTAADLVNAASEKELSQIFWKYGEDRQARKIARAIVQQRKNGKITSTEELAKVILSVKRRSQSDRTHPATRIFQALRIVVNDELASLEQALPQAVELLSAGGRLVVISFHSLEDRIVKNYFRENADRFLIVTEKPIEPTSEEIARNPRARSAKMRVAEKLT